MEKKKKKKLFSKKQKKRFFSNVSIMLGIILFSIFSLVGVYAFDVIGDYIKTQTLTGIGTNSNIITFSNHKTTYYINKDDDNNLIGDKLRGYYYDNIYGYFRLDWSNVENKNVHIISGPENINTCIEGYKFSGKAYSKYMGYINFNHDNNRFVYLCKDDFKIYGKTYSGNLGFQLLDGIQINYRPEEIIKKIEDKVDNIKNTDIIENQNSIVNTNQNWNNNNIGGGDKYQIEEGKINKLDGNVFWIIK